MTSRTRKKDVNAKLREDLALKLRIEGENLESIARQCGYADKTGAHYAIKRALDATPVENTEELRKIAHQRLEHLYVTSLSVLKNEATADDDEPEEKKPGRKKSKVNLFAVDRLVAITERHNKLMGLDIKPDDVVSANMVVVREIMPGYLDASSSINQEVKGV